MLALEIGSTTKNRAKWLLTDLGLSRWIISWVSPVLSLSEIIKNTLKTVSLRPPARCAWSRRSEQELNGCSIRQI